jgi:hypothetical protein
VSAPPSQPSSSASTRVHLSSRPVVWVAAGRSGSSSLNRCRPPGFRMDPGMCWPL